MMHDFLEFEELDRNYEQCRRYTRKYAKTFYFASHVLPKEKRMAAYAVYAFCRYADEVVDSPLFNDTRARRRLDELRDQVRFLYHHSPSMDRRLRALQHTVMRYGIPQEHFLDLLHGIEMDLDRKQYTTFADLYRYCYCVASTVGLIMTRIFGTHDDRADAYAEALGIAMQLTNILRDLGEDARRGRIYLPQEELERFGYSSVLLAQGTVNDHFRSLMVFNIERARGYYRLADHGIPMLAKDGSQWCVRMMRRTYAGILDDIERHSYNVFQRRAYVPTWKKFTIAIASAFRKEFLPQHAADAEVPAIPESLHIRQSSV